MSNIIAQDYKKVAVWTPKRTDTTLHSMWHMSKPES